MHESIVDHDSYFSEQQKKILLYNTVASVKPLSEVKDQADQLHVHTGKMLDYDQHSVLLLSAETGYDSQFVHASAKTTRKVHSTELGGGNF